MRLALGLQYDGAAFRGWQTQSGGGTVQDAVEQALAQLAAAPVPTVCAGRTDAGVHATYQVVHIDPPAARPLAAWVRGANSHLPAQAAVRWAVQVPETFHARFGARASAGTTSAPSARPSARRHRRCASSDSSTSSARAA